MVNVSDAVLRNGSGGCWPEKSGKRNTGSVAADVAVFPIFLCGPSYNFF